MMACIAGVIAGSPAFSGALTTSNETKIGSAIDAAGLASDFRSSRRKILFGLLLTMCFPFSIARNHTGKNQVRLLTFAAATFYALARRPEHRNNHDAPALSNP